MSEEEQQLYVEPQQWCREFHEDIIIQSSLHKENTTAVRDSQRVCRDSRKTGNIPATQSNSTTDALLLFCQTMQQQMLASQDAMYTQLQQECEQMSFLTAGEQSHKAFLAMAEQAKSEAAVLPKISHVRNIEQDLARFEHTC